MIRNGYTYDPADFGLEGNPTFVGPRRPAGMGFPQGNAGGAVQTEPRSWTDTVESEFRSQVAGATGERVSIEGNQMHYFPSDLAEGIDTAKFPFVHISIRQNVGDGSVDIFLQQPPGLTVSDGANYSNFDFGALSGGLTTLANIANNRSNFTRQDVLAGALLTKNTLSGSGGKLDIRSKAGIVAGVALNPNTRQAFDGVNVRTFSFNFKLVSQTAEESEMANNIEKTFRKFLYPKKSGEFALTYPPLFYITFYTLGGTVNKYMPRIKPCYLTGLESTFNESTNAVFKGTGAPIEVGLTLSFQEERALLRDDLFENDNTILEKEGFAPLSGDFGDGSPLSVVEEIL